MDELSAEDAINVAIGELQKRIARHRESGVCGEPPQDCPKVRAWQDATDTLILARRQMTSASLTLHRNAP